MDREDAEKVINDIVEMAEEDDDVVGVVLFGSFLTSESFNDVDLAIIVPDEDKRFDKLLKFQPYDDFFDLSVFEDLPIYVRAEIVREGKLVYSQDYDMVLDIFFRTIQDFESFEPFYHDYLRGVVDG